MNSSEEIELVLEAKSRDLGGMVVGRVLPAMTRRHVGPFVFFDHMGPVALPPGGGIDVRPHPHINLATVTYLFEGQILHRDSLGNAQVIEPGAINWMTAGRGIVHSERTPPELRRSGSRLHGLQLWVALPKEHEETDPAFAHYEAASIPGGEVDGVQVRVLAGEAFGWTSPVRTLSRILYVEAILPKGARLAIPREEERAVYVIEGEVSCGDERAESRHMLIFAEGHDPFIVAERDARVVIVGGAKLDGERNLYWNFVSSSKERIEQAKSDWREHRFPTVPGDDQERIPLPES